MCWDFHKRNCELKIEVLTKIPEFHYHIFVKWIEFSNLLKNSRLPNLKFIFLNWGLSRDLILVSSRQRGISKTLYRTLHTFYLGQPNYRCIWKLNFSNFHFENFQSPQSREDCQVKSEESLSTIHIRMIKMQILSARNLKHENEYFYFPKNKLCYWRIEDAKRYNSKLTATSEFISGIW